MHFLIACLVSLLFTLPSFAATIASTPLISGNLSDSDKFPISRSGSGVAYTGNVTKLKSVIRPNEVHVGVDVDALTLVDANTDVDNIGKTVVISSPVTLASDLTLATDRAWRFEKGAVITTTGYTFNANGASVDIGDYQVFTGTGAVTGLKESRPEWFGENTTPGTTDMRGALQSAINSLADGGVVRLLSNRYRVSGSLVPVAYSGHSGNIKSMEIVGTRSGRGVTDQIGSYNFGATLYVSSNVPDVPVISITAGSRGVVLKDLNIIGQGTTTPLSDNSVAIELVDASQHLLLDNITVLGFDTAIRITGQNNNDFTTISKCHFDYLNKVFLNTGINAYHTRLVDSYVGVYTNYVYMAVANGSNIVNPSFKAYRNHLGAIIGIVNISGTGALTGLDGIHLVDNVIEGNSSPASSPYIYNSNTTAANNSLGLIITGNVINGAETSDVYEPTWRWVKYYGRGPFIFEGNMVTNVPRPVFELGFTANSDQGGGGKIANNSFTNNYGVIWKTTDTYPAIEEYNNYATKFLSQRSGGGGVDLPYVAQKYRMYAGIIRGVIDIGYYAGYSFRRGGIWNQTDGASVVENLVKFDGSSGTLAGLTATLTSGALTATITAGTTAQKAAIYPGSFIDIGASGILSVSEVVGDTIYLRAAYSGATQTTQAISYHAPTIIKTSKFGTDPTGIRSGTVGDRVINTTPTVGQPKSWVCTVAGTPGTWVSEGNL